MIKIEPFKGDLAAQMYHALQKFRETGQALLTLPPLEAPAKEHTHRQR